MKDKTIIDKLISYGKNIRVGSIIFAILVLIGGFVIAEQAGKISEDSVLPVLFTYVLYSGGIILAGYITELTFNWMAAILRNIKK